LITCSSTQLDKEKRRGKKQTGGGVEEEVPEVAMSFVGVVVGLQEEGDVVATGGEV
jgi:hypothetical protein